ncbi:MAG TPA: NRDE family protein, partial [Longimicrobiaceae bacterium]|nr:NRDE family protein [Longimicrobiaceae bacterium]
LRALAVRAGEYAGFNLLVGQGGDLRWFGSRGGAARALEAGVYGLSNALLDTPWPKVVRGKAGLAAALAGGGEVDPGALFRVLWDAEPAPDAHLPDTGVGLERERMLSSPFIRGAEYGTRASTVLLVGRDGRVKFVERTVVPGHDGWTESAHEFEIGGAPAPATPR